MYPFGQKARTLQNDVSRVWMQMEQVCQNNTIEAPSFQRIGPRSPVFINDFDTMLLCDCADYRVKRQSSNLRPTF